jgi:hypothetical protein
MAWISLDSLTTAQDNAGRFGFRFISRRIPMRLFLLAFAVACCTTIASGENVIVTTTTVISAQETADDCARTGLLRHCRVIRGNQKEGIGFSTVSPESAEKSACFYNEAVRRRARRELVAGSPRLVRRPSLHEQLIRLRHAGGGGSRLPPPLAREGAP